MLKRTLPHGHQCANIMVSRIFKPYYQPSNHCSGTYTKISNFGAFLPMFRVSHEFMEIAWLLVFFLFRCALCKCQHGECRSLNISCHLKRFLPLKMGNGQILRCSCDKNLKEDLLNTPFSTPFKC
jgi:hypothetical protein